MSERWAPILGILLACGWALWRLRGLTAMHPAVFTVLCTAAVGTFYPVATSFVTPITWRHTAVPEDVVVAVTAQYLAFAVGLAAVLGARRRSEDAVPREASARRAWRDAFVAWSLLAVGALLYGLYVRRVGLGPLLNRHDYAQKYLAGEGLGPLAFGLNLVVAGCLWAEASPLAGRRKLPFRLAAAAVAVWSVAFVAVRSPAMALVLGHLYLLCVRRGIRLRSVRPAVVLALALVYVGFEGFSYLRGSLDGGLAEMAATLRRAEGAPQVALGQVVGGSELSHPFVSALEIARYEEPGALGGRSYREAPLVLLPRALAPERPHTLAQSFVAEYYPELADRGAGTAFSLVAEAWWNLGAGLGPLFFGLAVGAGLSGWSRHVRRSPHGVAARATPYLISLVLTLHRCTAAALLKQLVLILVPLGLLAALAELFLAATRRHGPAARPGPLARCAASTDT